MPRPVMTIVLALTALLAACGNKGDLVRPEPAAVTPSSIGAAEG